MKRSRIGALALASAMWCGAPLLAEASPPAGEQQRIDDILQRGIADANGHGGTAGFYIKEIGGGVLLAQNENHVFDPASVLKLVYHLTALRRVDAGDDALDNNVVWYRYPHSRSAFGDPSAPTLCPTPVDEIDANAETHSLGDTLVRMMRNSDNRATRGLDLRYGNSGVNQTSSELHLDQTHIDQIVGCGDDDGHVNSFTLADGGKLLEAVANQTALSKRAQDQFFSHMLAGFYDPSAPFGRIAREEAAAIGFQADDAFFDHFVSRMFVALKPGSYDFDCVPSCGHVDVTRAWDGLLTVPFRVHGAEYQRGYVWGTFIDRTHVDCDLSTCPSRLQSVTNATFLAYFESFRSIIRDALQTYMAPCPPADGFVSGPGWQLGSYVLGGTLGEYGRELSDFAFCYADSLGL